MSQAARDVPMTEPSRLELPPIDIPGILKKHGLRPQKSLGQNFIQDEIVLSRIVEQAGVNAQDIVLEVGPGLGSLTRHLAMAARRVTAVELDRHLIPLLQEVLLPFRNVEVIEGDILRTDPASLPLEDGYLVVANIPYYITSALIRHLLESSRRPSRLALTVQKEVAGRICASPGELSLLALSVQVYGSPRITGRIPAGSFYPIPKVDSAVVRVDLYPKPALPQENLDTFFKLAKAGFSQKRKTLRNAISASLRWSPEKTASMLQAASVDPQRRAETVSIEEWGRIVDVYQKTPGN